MMPSGTRPRPMVPPSSVPEPPAQQMLGLTPGTIVQL